MAAPAPVVITERDILPSSLAVRRSFSRTDPKYAHSFGDEAFRRTTKLGLKLIGWRVTDVVLQIWQKLDKPLRSLIEEKRPEWELKRPRSKAGKSKGVEGPVFFLGYFLVGVDKGHAAPHAGIICDLCWARRAIRQTIMKSRILERDGLHCFGLPESIELAASLGSDSDDESQMPGPGMLLQFNPFKITPTRQVRYDSFNGAEIEIRKGETFLGKATIGGVLQVGSNMFALTVGHPFRLGRSDDDDSKPGPSGNMAASSSGTDDRDFEILNDIDDDELGIFTHSSEPPRLGLGAVATEQSSPKSDDLSDVDMDDNEHSILEDKSEVPIPDFRANRQTNVDSQQGPRSGESVISSSQNVDLVLRISNMALTDSEQQLESTIITASNQTLDWALGGLPLHSQNDIFTKLNRGASPSSIIIKTPSELREGTLVSGGMLGIPTSTALQPVLVARVSRTQPGDCGSWAMKLRDGSFHGMLVACCRSLGDAYFLSMTDILNDISKRTSLQTGFGVITGSRPVIDYHGGSVLVNPGIYDDPPMSSLPLGHVSEGTPSLEPSEPSLLGEIRSYAPEGQSNLNNYLSTPDHWIAVSVPNQGEESLSARRARLDAELQDIMARFNASISR
jgi:hypothetical protein